ncbi:hypothetical protein LPJ66_009152 [Kickxella alabastrina]|uniref:Uncharacterized protein n=1 Tax=Kickxella alabastrina TaxID=61397 RepID=A0ACC1I4D0_9FUNG|nr:hypothetical protein LPJ66_009152 [Kickxella alabastrina]
MLLPEHPQPELVSSDMHIQRKGFGNTLVLPPVMSHPACSKNVRPYNTVPLAQSQDQDGLTAGQVNPSKKARFDRYGGRAGDDDAVFHRISTPKLRSASGSSTSLSSLAALYLPSWHNGSYSDISASSQMGPLPAAYCHGDQGANAADLVSAQQPAGKRRKRHHDIASKVRSVQPVPRSIDGNYIMPVQVGILTVLSLGRIVWDHSAYHNERYIWPVGYTVQREYYSMTDPNKQVIYTCWVTDGGVAPLFHVEAEDMAGSPIVAPTATGAWTTVLRTVNRIRQREHSNSASGPDYFGFSHPTIAKMIQDLHGADRCPSYIMQNFVEMKDRHVRGVIKKGRGGLPSTAMLSRGRRALMASFSALNQSDADARQGGDGPSRLSPQIHSCSAKRISVATLISVSGGNRSSPDSPV